MAKRLQDVQLPFIIPVWRRVALVGVCLGWAALEWSWGKQFWSILFGAVGVYCAHQFFVAFDPQPKPGTKKSPDTDPDEGGSS
jgi:hypothetical protein